MIEKALGLLPIGRRQVQQLQAWIPSATFFGAGAATLGLYFTDWKAVARFIPFYGGKFKEDE